MKTILSVLLCILPFFLWSQRDDRPIPCWEFEKFPDIKDSIKIDGFPEVNQSSTFGWGTANFVVDGNIEGNWESQNISHTKTEANPWLDIDLGQEFSLAGLKVYYPKGLYPESLGNYYVLISKTPFTSPSLLTELSKEQ